MRGVLGLHAEDIPIYPISKLNSKLYHNLRKICVKSVNWCLNQILFDFFQNCAEEKNRQNLIHILGQKYFNFVTEYQQIKLAVFWDFY